MEEVTLETAPPAVRDLFNRGFSALERGNLDYAIDMLGRCVELTPTFFRAWKFLRAAEVKHFRARNPGIISQNVLRATNYPSVLRAMAMLKAGKTMEAIKIAEKVLRKDPFNLEAVKALGRAAEVAKMPEIAIQVLASVREQQPDNILVLNWLGALYMETGQTRAGRECFESLVSLKPNDAAALKSLKDAMAIHSMSADGWTDAAASTSKDAYRRIIRDEKQSVLIEQQNKAVKGERDTEALITECLTKVSKEPGNINYRRALANLYASSRQWAEAIRTLEEAQQLTGARDPQIDAALTAIHLQQYDDEIKTLQDAGDTAAAEAKRAERAAYRFDDVRDRVSRYPNDLALKFDYGELLYERGQISEAIQQFQLAQRHAQRRPKALYYMGLCFKSKKQYDLAISQLEKAVSEQFVMDQTKKDILYELGLISEESGNAQKALAYFKQVYEVDISYRDVAAKIEKGYSAGSPQA